MGILELLRIFHKLCKKYNLTYWLDSGNLLGAYRHKGFIPWDDDMDVAMPREDYDNVVPILKPEFEKYGIIVGPGGIYDDMDGLQRLGVNYKTAETGIWMDIFPVDVIKSKSPLNDSRSIIHMAVYEYLDYYKKNKKRLSLSALAEKKAYIFSKYDELNDEEYPIYLFYPEFNEKPYCISQEDIYPLKEMEYEKVLFPVPNNTPCYLKEFYGESYMSFPRTGLEHHLDPDGATASTRAIRHGMNMEKEIQYLKEIADNI